jgi:hypothetical protein
MIVHPDFEKVWYGPRGMRAGITACIESKCVVSAVTLIYSAVDALSVLACPPSAARSSRSTFIKWVEDYLLPHLGGSVSGADVYGARCGIVHTYGPESDLSRKGVAKTLVYRWRVGHKPEDPLLAEHAKTSLVIEIEHLAEALSKAVEAFQVRIGADPELKGRVETNIQGLLCYEPSMPILIHVVEKDSDAAA